MSNLLVGCRATATSKKDGSEVEGVIVRITDYAHIMNSEGKIVISYMENVTIHPDDVKFITGVSKSHKFKQKILTEISDRFEILDL